MFSWYRWIEMRQIIKNYAIGADLVMLWVTLFLTGPVKILMLKLSANGRYLNQKREL